MKIVEEYQLDYQDLMLAPTNSEISSRKDVDTQIELPRLYSSYSPVGNPIFNANMGPFSFDFAYQMLKNNCFGLLHKWEPKDKIVDFVLGVDDKHKECEKVYYHQKTKNPLDNLFFTMGTRPEDLFVLEDVFKRLENAGCSLVSYNIRIDSPNGHNTQFLNTIDKCRNKFGNKAFIAAGNIVTGEKTKEVLQAGADMAVVGIGPGNQCQTRVKAAVGRPQASAVIDCAATARDMGGGIIADGGIKIPADVVKALSLGAHAVMIGSMFGGANETQEAKVINKDGIECKPFYGSASQMAHDKFYANKSMNYKSFEGICSLLPCTGPAKTTIDDILGGIRSAGSFIGAKSVKEFYEKAILYKVHNQISRMGK